MATYEVGSEPSPDTESASAFILELIASKMIRNKSLAFKGQRWYSVLAAQTDKGRDQCLLKPAKHRMLRIIWAVKVSEWPVNLSCYSYGEDRRAHQLQGPNLCPGPGTGPR